MNKSQEHKLSRRERQIVDALYSEGEASAQQVQALIPEPPSYSTVRALLARLLEKGVIDKRQEGAKYVYFPIVAREEMSQSALQRVVKTFFEGSPAKAVNALLGTQGNELSKEEIASLQHVITKLKGKG